MTEKILGLDMGISSIGWAIVKHDKENHENSKILKSGVRIFTIAENPKTGESLALPRRLARGARRTLKRKRQRIKAIKNLFILHLELTKEELFSQVNIYGEKKRIDIWQLRSEALKRKLSNREFARVLTHIAKRRGYKSNSKAQESGDKEKKKVLSAIGKNKKLLEKYLTIGEAIYKTTKDTKIRRNKKDDHKHSISRDMLLDEIVTIFKKQKEFDETFANNKFRDEYIKIFAKQKDFASVDKMVSTCSLEGKKQKRAPKRSYSAEEFVTLTKLINTKIIDKDGNERVFNKEELKKIIDLCKQSEKPTYIRIKNLMELDKDSYFKGVDFYRIDKKTGEVSKTATQFISAFKGFHELKKVVEKTLSNIHWQNIAQDKHLLNEIAKIFSYHKNDIKIEEELKKVKFNTLDENEKKMLIDELIEKIQFEHFLHVSIKAIDKILPFMHEGKRYDEAVKTLGYKSLSGKKERLLRGLNKKEMNELTNPVVKRAIAQTRKVVNALIRKYGQFDKVHIELTREIKKSHKDRSKLEKDMQKYQDIKEGIVNKFIEDYGKAPRGNELLKFRLLQEQDYRCIYSGKELEPERLLEYGYVEIDHILPFSRSLEDAMLNKVICLKTENQNKKDRTPYEYFMDQNRDWEWFDGFVKSFKNIKKAKISRLLKKNFDENSEKEFKTRNINDTAYMARFIKNFIEENLELTSKSKKKVVTINGMLTSMLRHNWAVGKKSRDNHLHHAVDAIVVAFATQSEVQKLSSMSAKINEFAQKSKEEKTKKLKFKPPMENFRDEVQESIDNIFVSFAPRRGVTGEAHEQTIYSPKDFRANKKQSKSSSLTGGSVVRNIKLNNETKLAKQSKMPRVDIFKNTTTNKYYVVPIYTFDFIKDKLPNKAIVSGKNRDGTQKEWLDMDENFKFIFSVYKNELLEIQTKKTASKEGKKVIGYFVSAHSGTGKIIIKSHDNKEKNLFKRDSSNVCSLGMGIQNATSVKKYQVCPLGVYTEIKSEKRIGTKRMK
ncbi:MAG: type II CRISPR RNA-guided endonuclease Cas9 [Sulfurospirillum sp.]|nr:type II CRISPR RNA-guided endonuclease Cas9 [Sulfurospirillum sp.]